MKENFKQKLENVDEEVEKTENETKNKSTKSSNIAKFWHHNELSRRSGVEQRC